VLLVSSTNKSGSVAWQRTAGHFAGCLWLMVAGAGFLFAGGAAGVGIDATIELVPLLLVPLAIAVVVFVAGDRSVVMALSAVAGAGYSALGVWNELRAADFERANPGATDISGGLVSLMFALFAFATAAWSLGMAGLVGRTGRR
jgi:hypothetical protein